VLALEQGEEDVFVVGVVPLGELVEEDVGAGKGFLEDLLDDVGEDYGMVGGVVGWLEFRSVHVVGAAASVGEKANGALFVPVDVV